MEFSRRRLLAAGLVAAVTPIGYAADHADDMDAKLAALLKQHETTDPAVQVAAARALRTQVTRLASAKVGPVAGMRLRRAQARAAAVEAAAGTFIWSDEESLTSLAGANALAVKAGDKACTAFCLGCVSVVYRYAGNAPLAVKWARVAGEQVPQGHPARATMAMHEARALVELPEDNAWQVSRVLDDAIEQAGDLPADRIGLPGVNFDLASPVEVRYGSVIAMLRGGRSVEASGYFDAMAGELDLCAGPGKRAMLRVEQAISDAKFGRLRLDMSCALVDQALAVDPSFSTSLGLRLDEWCRLARRHPGVAEVRDTVGRIRTWQRSGT